MSSGEIEMSDVIVVLDELDDQQTDAVVTKLKQLGMHVDSVDNDNSIVEGTLPAAALADVKKVQHVRYIRNVFNYAAETGDTGVRETDGGEE